MVPWLCASNNGHKDRNTKIHQIKSYTRMAAHCAMPTDETIIATETSRSSFGRFCRNFSVKRFVPSCHFSSNRIWENRRVLQKYLSIGLRLKMDYYVSNVILSKLKTRSANVKKMLNWTKPFFRQSSLFECFISVSLKIHLIWVCAWVPNFAGIYSPKKK